MSDYNLAISGLTFNCLDNFSMTITIKGDEFPKPDDLKGTINGDIITFSFNSQSTERVNSATFIFEDDTVNSSYKFIFTDYPDGMDYNIHGTIDTSIASEGDYFLVEECSFMEEVDAEPLSESSVLVSPMKGTLKIRKRPHVVKNYACTNLGLNPTNTSLVMTLIESGEDKLWGDFNNIAGELLVNGLNLDTSVLDGNPVPNTIGMVSMKD